MKLSKRIRNLSTSPIRKLNPYAKAAKDAGKKIYHLNIGQPDIATPPQFMESIRNYKEDVIAYADSKGEAVLIKAIQKYYAEKGIPYNLEEIFITNGGSEALSFAIMALCDYGDEVLVFEPYYANYASFTKKFDVVINAVQTSVEKGYHLPDEEEIERHITPKTKAILITNPGNPTGVVYTNEEMEMISRIVRKYDLALIADEVYREFVYDGFYRSFATMPELDDSLIMIDSVSKRFSACGARIGCVISKNKDFNKEMIKCCQSRLSCPVLEQIGAAALYDTPESYLKKTNLEYKKRRDTIVSALEKLPGVAVSDPKGAFYVMVSFPVDDAEKFAIWTLENFSIDGKTVMFAPGNGFYDTPSRGMREARLAYVLKSEDIEDAIYILGEALKAYPGYTLS